MLSPEVEKQLRDTVSALPGEALPGVSFPSESIDTYKDAIIAASIVNDEGKSSLQRWILAGVKAGLSWSDIGELLGISKQAAQQRFRSTDIIEPSDEFFTRTGVTGFNEMGVMAADGLNGLELTGVGTLTLYYRRTDLTWEYERVVSLMPGKPTSKRGWEYVTSWYPFHYFKRPLQT